MSDAMREVRYLVLGAGMSGLAFADWVKSDDLLVVEAEEEVGGYCRTIVQDGFVWDYSGHFFHFRRPEIEHYLVERMEGQKVLVVEKDSRIWFGERWVDFPFQKNIHQLPKQDFIDCLYDLYFKDETQGPGEGGSFESMLYAKFGRSIAEKFLIPYNEKLYATDLNRLDEGAMGRFFPYADVDQIVRNFRQADNASYNTSFTYPEGGAIQYVRALERGVPAERIQTGCRVERIDLEGRIAHTTAGPVRYRHLISSAPFPQLLAMCGLPFDASIYSWNKVLVFNLGFDRKGPEGVHWAYFPQREVSFYRVGFYDNIFATPRMSLYAEVGYASDAPLDAAAIEAARLRVLEDLARVGLVQGHELVSHAQVLLDPAYVHITQDSVADVAAKKRALATAGVHSIGRYGSWTYCSIEDNIVEARALAEAFDAA
ncbi:MAG: FAD-dependent oxidoreductase, partial [Myxococcota bacterium]